MNQDAYDELLRLARRYIWWESSTVAVRRPERVIAQVMNLGDYDAVQRMISVLGVDPLQKTLLNAESGWFNGRSWSYWCYRLGVVKPGAPVPPMPKRTF